LKELDETLRQQKGLYYVRYMDDILILSQTRWQNRRAIRILNQRFNRLKLQQHPDKTFIGKIEKGFDFLGYHFSRDALLIATKTVKKHVEKLLQLYEQQNKLKASPEELAVVLGRYIQRWMRWCTAGITGMAYAMPALLTGKQPLPVALAQSLTCICDSVENALPIVPPSHNNRFASRQIG
jgi:hypothetical protein